MNKLFLVELYEVNNNYVLQHCGMDRVVYKHNTQNIETRGKFALLAKTVTMSLGWGYQL